jgi:hypothetical protein
MSNALAHRWALAVPGILTTVNGHDHALLGGAIPSADAGRSRAEALLRDWGVNDRSELLKMLVWLASEGHRKDFNDVCAFDLQMSARLGPQGWVEDLVDDQALLKSIHFSRRHRARVGTRSLLAWDMARLITLAGWGYFLQWISEGEAWSYILAAAQAVQRSYGSWEELGQHQLLGREYWANDWVTSHARAFRSLLDDPASPWRVLHWHTDLREPDRMIPLQEVVVAAPPQPGSLARMRNPFLAEGVRPGPAIADDPTASEDEEPASPSEPAFMREAAAAAPVGAADTTGGGSKVIVIVAMLTTLAITGIVLAYALGAFSSRGAASPPRPVASAAATSVPSPRPGTTPPAKKR